MIELAAVVIALLIAVWRRVDGERRNPYEESVDELMRREVWRR